LDAGVAALLPVFGCWGLLHFFKDVYAGICCNPFHDDINAKELFSLPSLLAILVEAVSWKILHASAININETDSGLKRRRN
jgi:hypothetical protein